MSNVIASLHFGTPPTPSTPAEGKKVFLGSDNQFKTIDASGVVAVLGGGGILSFPNKTSFPAIGQDTFIYVSANDGNPWRWDSVLADYVLLVSEIDAGIY
jgi:hypothetical protein